MDLYNPNILGIKKTYSMYRDWNNKPVERTPHTHIYSYDAYVIHKKKQEYQHAVYSDRLQQHQGYEKWKKAIKSANISNAGSWNNTPLNKIEKFLQIIYDEPNLKFVGLMNGCNVSNGYPYWIFMFDCDFK